ncbi:MAG: hypothetical protein A2065_00675 [Alphaproteobacteria bacterium GWB1_45_5]|nr:MAG: hypothetical protein A2065_00675 [Alphaproteobacteria bacterium GWB1_45_5]
MENQPLGIVMGKGDLPSLLIDFCKKNKRPYLLFPIKYQVDVSFIRKHPHVWVSFGQIKKNLDLLRKYNIKELVFVGTVQRPRLLSLNLDWMGWKWLVTIGWKAFGDDGLLSGIIGLFEKEGFKIVGAHQLIRDLLMPQGKLGKIDPTGEDKKNIALGFEAAKELGRQDRGQGVIVENGFILARETMEGTDWMLKEKAPLLSKTGSAILVKVSKPQQEKRVDLPTIGPETIENLARYGYKGIALEAENGFLLHPEKVIKLADQKGIFVYGVTEKKV